MRRRLVLAIAAVATVAVVALAVPLGLVLDRSYREQELLRLQRDTVAATRSIDVGSRRDPVELPSSPDRLGVYDLAGRRVAGEGPPAAPAVVRDALRLRRPATDTTGDQIVVAVPLASNERVAGVVRGVRSDAAAGARARSAWLVIGLGALAIVAAAVLAAVLLGRRLSRPLERLAAAASRLGDGDFSVRAPRSGIPEPDAVAGALDATAERLDALVTRERAFSADASHQLRTPLQALRIELEAMELGGDAPPGLPVALTQVDRLQGTIETLLAVARDVRPATGPVELADVLDEARVRWHGPLAAEGRPLRISIDGSARVQASQRVMGEVLDVLLDNACRHGAGEVTVTARSVGAYVAIDVEDEGPGFPADPEEAFARRSESREGHGIGLALARSLTQAEGGRLTATRAGHRATVSLVLPSELGVG